MNDPLDPCPAVDTVNETLWAPRSSAPPHPVPVAGSGGGLRILIADDHEVLRLVLHRLLACRGHEVDEASDGLEALERARLMPYDVLLLDIQMPVMGGLEVACMLREAPLHRPKVIIGISSESLAPEEVAAVGMDGFLNKPILAHDLDQALARFVGRRDRSCDEHAH